MYESHFLFPKVIFKLQGGVPSWELWGRGKEGENSTLVFRVPRWMRLQAAFLRLLQERWIIYSGEEGRPRARCWWGKKVQSMRKTPPRSFPILYPFPHDKLNRVCGILIHRVSLTFSTGEAPVLRVMSHAQPSITTLASSPRDGISACSKRVIIIGLT